MPFLGTLRRQFLNALPVIGPHADIEAELLLAGKKPVGWLAIPPSEYTPTNWRDKKEARDIKILDQAVADGTLKSKDDIKPDFTMRYYYQPDCEEEVLLAMAINNDDPAASQSQKDWDEILGYRKRDVVFFNYYNRLPYKFKMALVGLNAETQMIHREELLRECGIDPHEWAQQLRREHIFD